MGNDYAKRIVAEESAKAALRPFIITLESVLNRVDGVDYAEIDPDTGNIYGELAGGQEFVVKVEAAL